MNKSNQEHARVLETVAGAVIGVDVIAVFQMITLASLDAPLTTSLYAFAVAIPLLTAFLLNLLSEDHAVTVHDAWYNGLLFSVGLSISLLGVGFCFRHLSAGALTVFMAACAVGFITILHFLYKVVKSGKRKGQ